MFVGCPIFGRQGRGVLHTPHKRPDRGEFMFVGCPIFGRQGRGAKAYAPQNDPKGRSYLSIGRHIYPCGIHVGRMQYAPTLPAGDVSYLYPQRLPRSQTLSFLVFHFLIYLPLMIQIEDTIVSLDVIERRFMCDLSQCRGACCIEGESGAPLEEGEAEQLRLALPEVWDELKEDAREVIRQQGVSYLDADGDEVTSIVNGRDCVFTRYAPDGTCHCALEQAFREGRTTFMKPISCRLYPVRVTQYRRFRAVNLHRWEVCRPAKILGERLGIPAYRFLREPLISKFGTEWYAALEAAAEMVARQSEQK